MYYYRLNIAISHMRILVHLPLTRTHTHTHTQAPTHSHTHTHTHTCTHTHAHCEVWVDKGPDKEKSNKQWICTTRFFHNITVKLYLFVLVSYRLLVTAESIISLHPTEWIIKEDESLTREILIIISRVIGFSRSLSRASRKMSVLRGRYWSFSPA